MPTQAETDSKLLNACLAGDRQAFGQIVERYQSLVCAVAYSATGDLALSEEIAQETFITAWMKLKELRDPSKLRAWLRGIARNLVHSSIRRSSRDVTQRAEPLDTIAEPEKPAASPGECAISEEEESILWRALGELPETYREPMILYYREQRSVQCVAETLDLSEDAVKQRLSRGRMKLKEQVAAFVEGTLARTGPKKTLAIAVLAALPAASPQITAAGIAASAAKGSSAAKAAVAASLSGAIWGPLLGLLGAFIGAWASIANTKSPRERSLMVKMTWIVVAYVLAFGGVICALILATESWSPGLILTTFIIATGTYCVGLIILILWTNRSQRKIQIEEGTYTEPKYQPVRMTKGNIFGAFAGSIFGSVCWIFCWAYKSGDWIAAATVLLVSVTIFIISTNACLRSPKQYYRIVKGAIMAVAALNLIIVNLRWEAWMRLYRETPDYSPSSDLPLWVLNLIILGVFAFLFGMFMRMESKQRTVNCEIR
ncbi:MAG: RNA polymerase sigma factor [bacterium]